jgi:hypothetical protein
MLTIFIFIFSVYGFSNMIVYTSGPFKIFDYLKIIGGKIHPDIEHLLSCMICLPTWAGIILSLINIFLLKNVYITPANLLIHNTNYWPIILLLDAGFASGISWLINTIQLWFETNIK